MDDSIVDSLDWIVNGLDKFVIQKRRALFKRVPFWIKLLTSDLLVVIRIH